jgi:hypothetical protein
MKQEVRIQLDVSLTLDAKHSDEEVRAIVERGARNAWPNNHKHFHALSYAEERHIYHHYSTIQWQPIFTNNQPHNENPSVQLFPPAHVCPHG